MAVSDFGVLPAANQATRYGCSRVARRRLRVIIDATLGQHEWKSSTAGQLWLITIMECKHYRPLKFAQICDVPGANKVGGYCSWIIHARRYPVS